MLRSILACSYRSLTRSIGAPVFIVWDSESTTQNGMKKPRPKKRKTQHDKFVEAAKRLGADESEHAFARTLKKIAPNPKKSER